MVSLGIVHCLLLSMIVKQEMPILFCKAIYIMYSSWLDG
jgi:hypothetical protein